MGLPGKEMLNPYIHDGSALVAVEPPQKPRYAPSWGSVDPVGGGPPKFADLWHLGAPRRQDDALLERLA